MKTNCKGFVLLETLIVAVFVVGIFTFLYTTVIPLLGTYEDLTTKDNIDIVYKLYHIRKSLYNDPNYSNIINNSYGKIDCNSFTNRTYCQQLVSRDYLDLSNKGYELFYTVEINDNMKNAIKDLTTISDELKNYINKYQDDTMRHVIFLHDLKSDSITHLGLAIDLHYPYDYSKER